MSESPSCIICRATTVSFLKKDGYEHLRCTRCGLVSVFPQPTLEFLRTKVYSKESGFQSNRVEDLATTTPSRRHDTMCRMLTRFKPDARLLDVGCGGGQLMFLARKRGLAASGVELNQRLADSARAHGFQVFSGTIAEAAFPRASFDAVSLGEIIEHVNDPRAFVRDAAEAIAPGGVLLITTPNMDCVWSRTTLWLYRTFGIPWSTATPPYHLFVFSASNLDLLLGQEGFERVAEEYLPPPTLRYELGSLHLLKRFKESRNPFDLAFLLFAFSLYVPLHALCRAIHPFVRQDFSMLHLYKKKTS